MRLPFPAMAGRRYSSHAPLAAVLIVAIAVGGMFWTIQPIIFTNDSPGYLEAARFFIHAPDGKYAYLRTPLFELLMAATGVAELRTFHILLAIQFALGIAMPLSIYVGLSGIERRMAAIVAVLFAFTLLPFLLIGVVMPWQLFFFLFILAISFACRFVGTGRIVDIYASALIAFLAVMTRPQGSYVFLVLLAIELIAAPRLWRHCAAAALLVFALQFAYMAARPYFVGPIAQSGEVLLSDLRQSDPLDDQGLYRRALLFVKQNLVDDGRTIAAFIADPSLRRRVHLAAVLQLLLNRNPVGATQQALDETDPQVRNEALFYIAWERKAAGEGGTAQNLHDRIDDPALQAELETKWERPPEIPVLTADAPADGQIEPRPYISGLDMTNTSGRMLLIPALVARNLDAGALIVPQNGPATAALYRTLTTYFGAGRTMVDLYPTLAASERDPQRAVDALFTRLSPPDAHWTLWTTMDRLYGPVGADKLLGQVCVEFVASHALVLVELYAVLATETLFRWNIVSFAHEPAEFPRHPSIATTPVFKNEIARSKNFLWIYDPLGNLYTSCFPAFTTAVVILAAFGLFAIRERSLFLTWALCWLVALHQLAVTVITAATYADFAYYTSIVTIFLVMAAGISAHATLKRVFPSPRPATAR